MTKEQLEELVALGESEQVEFKETTGQREDACETLCAFLNADGGTVVFGVSRKGKLTGQLVSDSTRRDPFELNMIDTMGYGIHRMYAEQARRYMPLHDYLITPQSVTMTIYGHFVNEAYSSLLVKRPDFQLKDICWLDRVQKGLPIPADVAAGFRKRGLIDGRKPHLRIAVEIPSDENEALIGHEQLRERYRRIFIDFLHRFPGASRQKINDFMIPQMGGEMSENEKAAKISNLMTGLRRKGVIENRGTDKKSQWFLQ